MVNRDADSLVVDGADSLLVLNHHNGNGDRASVVRVTGRVAGNQRA